MPQQLITTAVALLVGAIVTFLLSRNGDDLRLRLRSALSGSILTGSLVTLIWIQVQAGHLWELRQELTRPNPLAQIDAKLEQMGQRDSFADRLRARRDDLRTDIADLADGTIRLRGQDDVVEEWRNGVSSSVSTIDATNFVAPSFWRTSSRFASEQGHLQKLAVGRGVRIRRVFIFLEGDPTDVQRIRELGNAQTSLAIRVRYISHRRLISLSAYARCKQGLRGAFDVVVFDLNRALLTYTDVGSRLIESGFASNSRTIVDAAREFFEAVWASADPAPQ